MRNLIVIVFQVLLNFDALKKNTENAMSHLYFNEESDYSEENTCGNEVYIDMNSLPQN